MTRIREHIVQRVSIPLLAMALAACTSTGPDMAGADPAKAAWNQKKQAELQYLKEIGQR